MGIRPTKEVPGGLTEYSFVIREALRNGLAPDPRVPRNTPYLEEMLNLRATEYGAATPEAITNPITSGPTPDWGATGVVQMVRGEQGRYVLGQTRAYTADSSWVASAIGSTFTAGGPWHFVSFQDFAVFSNGVVFFFSPLATVATPTQHTTPTINAVGKDGNRLLLGGVAGAALSTTPFTTLFQRWKNVHKGDRLSYTSQAWGTGWIMYGERGGGYSDMPFATLFTALGAHTWSGSDNIDSHMESALENNEWGLCPLRYPGAVMAFHELDRGPIAFGANGVAALARDEGLYADQRIHPVGIAGRGAVGGDLTECVFIDTAGEAWRIDGGGIKRLRFPQYLGALTDANITVAFDPEERAYWISDKTTAYVLAGDTLSGPFEVFPSSLVREGGTLYGVIRDTRADTSKRTVRVKTVAIDNGERATKHLSCLQIGQEKIDALAGGCDYRYDDSAAAYGVGPRTQATPESVVFPWPRVSFNDAKIVVQGTVANSVTGRLETVEVRYQAENKSARRGTKGVPEVA